MAITLELGSAVVLFSGRAEGDLGRTSGEAPDAVLANRAALLERCAVVSISVPQQVHGSAIATVARASGYAVGGASADGIVTTAPGAAVAIHAADCLPIAIAGDGGVAVVHAGWRGLAAGVVGEGIRTLRELGVGGPLEAAIGPGARGCCYEAGPEVHAAFAAYDASDGPRVSLATVARAQLEQAGVSAVDVGVCTLCAPVGAYFSHRRDGAATGRQAGVAWLR